MSHDQALLERLAALESRVAQLEHARATEPRGVTMRRAERCPGCGGTSFVFLSELEDRTAGAESTPMALQAEGAFFVKYWGKFQAYVCRSCHLVELYVDEIPDGLKPDKHENLDFSRDTEGPFR